MKASFQSYSQQLNRGSVFSSSFFKALFLMLCFSWGSTVMAQEDPIRNIQPGVNTFEDAIESNPGRKYKIQTWNSANLVDGVYVKFAYQELVFPALGVELTSQEVRGKKFKLKPSKAEIVKVQFSKPKKAAFLLREMIPGLSNIPFPDQSQKAVEKALGKPNQKSDGHLRYTSLGLHIYFYKSEGSRKYDRIRHIFLTPISE